MMSNKRKIDDRTFRRQAPGLMARLMADVPGWSPEDAAACLGNAGHESAGFTKLQEMKPTVAGSRGGWGWFQWTGPRRRAFEAWADGKGLDRAGVAANYGFLIKELRGSERGAVGATRQAQGLAAKVKAFEMAYERAGVKHYSYRLAWARIALAEWEKTQRPAVVKPQSKAEPLPVDDEQPEPVKPVAPDAPQEGSATTEPAWKRSPVLRSIGQLGAWLAAGGSALLAADWKVIAVLSVVGVLLAFLALRYQLVKVR